jgi:hypothetical protein
MIHHFECLPNEILIDCFQYFNARDLFQSFYNLNIHFNLLIQSFHQLKLIFHLRKPVNNPSFVHTLIVSAGVDVNLHQFPNIRRLKLEWPTKNELEQLRPDVLPYLEELSLVYIGIVFNENFANSSGT